MANGNAQQFGLLGALLAGAGGVLAQRRSKRQRKRFKRLLAQVEANARRSRQSAIDEFFNAPGIAGAQRFLTEAFEDPLGGQFGREAQGRLLQAQAARGLTFGGSAAAQEAGLLTRLADQRRRQLIPLLTGLQAQAQQLGQQAFQREFIPFNLLSQQGPQTVGSGDILSSVTQGLFGGSQIGFGLDIMNRQQNLLEKLFAGGVNG